MGLGNFGKKATQLKQINLLTIDYTSYSKKVHPTFTDQIFSGPISASFTDLT